MKFRRLSVFSLSFLSRDCNINCRKLLISQSARTMPPKKAKGKGEGKKKKKSAGKEKPKPGLFESDLLLPVIPSSQGQALQSSVINSDARTMTRMIEHYNCLQILKEADANGSSPIHLSCRRNDIDMTTKLLSYGVVDVNRLELRMMGGLSALHIACQQGSLPLVRLLLQHGADMHLKADSATGERPLHSCCMHGQLGCARLLLEAGVQTDLRDGYGHNASYWAAQKGFPHLIADLELPPSKAATAQEYMMIMLEKTKGHFVLPTIGGTKKKGKDGKDGKGKGKGKKK